MDKSRKIITLTTDWGSDDIYPAIVKAHLYTNIPDVEVADISHNIAKHDINQASFILKHGCLQFPAGTIHIIDVGARDAEAMYDFIVLKHQSQYFICSNNGLLSTLFLNPSEYQAYRINNTESERNSTFYVLDKIVPLVVRLANCEDCTSLVTPISEIKKISSYLPMMSSSQLNLHIAYIDSYGNAFLDITATQFEEYRKGRAFKMYFQDSMIDRITPGYPVPAANTLHVSPVLVVSSTTGLLQICYPYGSAAQLVGLKEKMSVTVNFDR